MTTSVRYFLLSLMFFIPVEESLAQQGQPYTASFIGRMGEDTVLVETYTMINNHIYGKAFIRVPEDYIGEFSIHFYPDGTIREFNINAMDPYNSSIPFKAQSGAFEYRLNMNCINDTCYYYNSEKGKTAENIFKHPAAGMDFVGGWVPLISLMEWQCVRLIQSGKKNLPLKMINHNIGVYDIGVRLQGNDTVIFGGPFLEYTKIKVNEAGRVINIDGTGTPWNYLVSHQSPINIDKIAERMAGTKGIGVPSKTETIESSIQNSTVSVSYGRPLKRGRQIFGGVVPYDSVWRTGANSATVIQFEKNISIGKTFIPKGKYSIYTIPNPDEWTLIFSSDLTSWPTDPDRGKEVEKVKVPTLKTKKITELFTIEVVESKKGGVLRFAWDDIVVAVDFEIVK